jgi:hypothetical protein
MSWTVPGTFLVFLLVLPLIYLFCQQVYLWFQLRSAPGPFLASTSNIWRAYNQYTGQLRVKLLDLHVRHGPIVRYGVNSISINDPDAIQTIYTKRGFTIVSHFATDNKILLTTWSPA